MFIGRKANPPAAQVVAPSQVYRRPVRAAAGPLWFSLARPASVAHHPASPASEEPSSHAEASPSFPRAPVAEGGPVVTPEAEPALPSVQQIAQRGLTGSVSALPHLARIQAAFGPAHDLSRVEAHVGGEARDASDLLGASAYATGDRVAFRNFPDVRLAAHEAAHVVQQRSRVSFAGSMSEPGDRHEQHADAVAERVALGASAADLLESVGGGPGAPPPRAGAEDDGTEPTATGEAGGQEAAVVPGADVTADAAAPRTPDVFRKGGGNIIDRLRAAAVRDEEQECLTLIKQLSDDEMKTVRSGDSVMRFLARSLDAAQMFQAVTDLKFSLPWKVYWVDRAGNVKKVDWIPTIEAASDTERGWLRSDQGMMKILASALDAKRMLAVVNALRSALSWKVYWVDRAGSVDDVNWFPVLAATSRADLKGLAGFPRGMELMREVLFRDPEKWRKAVAAQPDLRALFEDPQRSPMEQLQSEADRANVNEELCLSLLHTLTAKEKGDVRRDHPLLEKLASAFNESEIVTAVNAIDLALPWKVYWIERAVSLSEVSARAWTGMVASASDQELRDLVAFRSGKPLRETSALLSAVMKKAPDLVLGLVAAPRGDVWKEALGDAGLYDLPPRPVSQTNVERMKRLDLLGDGAANPGIDVGEFEGYIARQADWFVEPSLTAADRDLLWPIAILLQEGGHVGGALRKLKLVELGAMKAEDRVNVLAYAAGAAANAKTVQITRPHATLARVIELGKAMVELGKFVPGPVLSICINQTTLEKLVDEVLLPELRTYYATFKPTIENPDEQGPLLALLRDTIAPYATLVGWVNDLHIFTKATRVQLVTNVADKSRALPVLLVLMSGLDWNGAFLQASNLEAAVTNPSNLALVVQSRGIKDEIAMVNKVADEYGQIPSPGAKGVIGQVVFAGHGSDRTIEQTTTGANAKEVKTPQPHVVYDQATLSPNKPGDDSELLIDTVLSRMDVTQARVVFAGCLVGSHKIPAGTPLADPKKAAGEINAALKANPNLRDLVRARMIALGIAGDIEAANASTQFRSFKLDPAGKAQLSLGFDPDIGKSKADYVKTGAEPEGALRAALETWADPALGPAWTTAAMRAHVAAKSGDTGWWQTLTCTAFSLVLPAAGNVDPAAINELAARVETWLLAGWKDSANAARLAASVKPGEVSKVYTAMLGSERSSSSFLAVVVEQAWMSAVAGSVHETAFMAALDATSLKRVELTPLLAWKLIDPHLPALMTAADPAKPSRAQLILALAIAVARPSAIPAPVLTLLRGAAGGAKTTSFPVALGVEALLDGASELEVLRRIGLAPGVAVQPPPPSTGAPTPPPALDEANVDVVTGDKLNDTFLVTAARETTITGKNALVVHSRPAEWSAVVGSLAVGQKVRIAGTVEVSAPKNGQRKWTAIDLGGKLVFARGVLP